jgi:hypothetical protein
METLAAFWVFLKSCGLLMVSLPDILKLVQAIQKAADEAETERKVSTDLKVIHEAFETNDPSKLNALFSSK